MEDTFQCGLLVGLVLMQVSCLCSIVLVYRMGRYDFKEKEYFNFLRKIGE